MNTEAQEQELLVQWLRIKGIFHFAPTNENNSYKQDRKWAMVAEVKAKKTGKLKGLPDLFVVLDDKLLVIELKRAKKRLKSGKMSTSHTKVSKEQETAIKRFNEFSYIEAKVCYGWIEAKEFIEEWL